MVSKAFKTCLLLIEKMASRRRFKHNWSRAWFDFWYLDDPWRKNRSFWQITGHILQDTMLETVWSFGRYCGSSICNFFLCLDFRRKQAFIPMLRFRPAYIRDSYNRSREYGQ